MEMSPGSGLEPATLQSAQRPYILYAPAPLGHEVPPVFPFFTFSVRHAQIFQASLTSVLCHHIHSRIRGLLDFITGIHIF